MPTPSPTVAPESPADAAPAATPSRPLNVCMMVDNLARAGVEMQILQLIARMDRRVVRPHLCLLDGTGAQSQALEPANCPVLRLGVKSLCRPSTLAKALRFARYLRRHKMDVVHPHFQDSMYFAAPVAKLAGVPCVVRFRVNLGYWMRPIDRRLMRFYNRFIDATLVNCRACRDAVMEQEHAPPHSITIIPNGVDLAQFAAPPIVAPSTIAQSTVAPSLRDGILPTVSQSLRDGSSPTVAQSLRDAFLPSTPPITIGVVANLRPVKGLDVFIRAAALVAARHESVRFVIAGEGDSRSELHALISELGLADRFDLPGRIDDVPGFLRGIDLAVLSSRSEGAPNVIMEYMAAGKPLVATDVGGVAEIVEHEKNGLIVPPDRPDELAAAINRLLATPDLAARLAAAAHRHAFAEFGLDKQARRYEAFYVGCIMRAIYPGRGGFLRLRAPKDANQCLYPS